MSEMTNSAAEKAPDKRERLIGSARALIHEQGVHRTTLADIAQRADVPLGNVYYYFKSKDDLIGAVLEGYKEEAAVLTKQFERHRSPQTRLKALIHNWSDMRETIARHGCPMGTLCAELDKDEDSRDSDAAAVMRIIIDWAEAQFRELGRSDARDLAITLFAGIQGAALLANTFRDPAILTRQGHNLERWIDSLARA
jgi:TetR/AcrR family transcriptional regulator, transcriptional repressor for nem operon